MHRTDHLHRVVIVGGGFAGLNAAMALRRSPVSVTLIDRRNFHLFQPLLYQVATGGLSPANIAAPLRGVLGRQQNCRVLLGDVRGFDVANRAVRLADGDLPYDTLIVAAGATHSYFGRPEWAPLAPGLKTIEDATEIRRRVLTAFENAERCADPAEREPWLNFVIVGGGPTGVELAGALAEIARHSLKHDFRSIDPGDAHIVLVEAGPRILAAFPPDLSDKAAASLRRLGVSVQVNVKVTAIAAASVTLQSEQETRELAARTVLWAAGVQCSPLARALADATGATTDRAGRGAVNADLSLSDHPEILVLGDMALCLDRRGRPLPGVAPVAIAQGKFAAKLIDRRLRGRRLPTFRYRDLGSLATIGRSAAVADIGRVHFSGFFAWVLWLFIHLMKIVTFRNRLLVFVQWFWSYFSYDRAARLITGQAPTDHELPEGPQAAAADETRRLKRA